METRATKRKDDSLFIERQKQLRIVVHDSCEAPIEPTETIRLSEYELTDPDTRTLVSNICRIDVASGLSRHQTLSVQMYGGAPLFQVLLNRSLGRNLDDFFQDKFMSASRLFALLQWSCTNASEKKGDLKFIRLLIGHLVDKVWNEEDTEWVRPLLTDPILVRASRCFLPLCSPKLNLQTLMLCLVARVHLDNCPDGPTDRPTDRPDSIISTRPDVVEWAWKTAAWSDHCRSIDRLSLGTRVRAFAPSAKSAPADFAYVVHQLNNESNQLSNHDFSFVKAFAHSSFLEFGSAIKSPKLAASYFPQSSAEFWLIAYQTL